MANQNNNQNDKSVAKGVKKTAGSAFETVHNALETTENAAMGAVDTTKNVTMGAIDATKNAAKHLTGNADQNQARQ